jgi:hypothetical protein
MKIQSKKKLKELIEKYNNFMEVMESDAAKAVQDDSRAYGGFVRAAKGKMQEFITETLVRVAWDVELKGNPQDLTINSKKIRVPMQMSYVDRIKNRAIRDHILANMKSYYYGLSVDKHLFIKNKFVVGIECKAYTENAMLKRILVDFHLLKTKFPNLVCYLFQLESQLGGDYATTPHQPKGSSSTHTLMSYFPDVDLNIVTLLDGERKVDRPINKRSYFKPLNEERLENALMILVDGISGAVS